MRKTLFFLAVILVGASVFFLRRDVKLTNSEPPPPPPSEPQIQTHTLAFVGDIMLSRAVGRKMVTNDDFSFPFRVIGQTLSSYDFLFGNLETPISTRGTDQKHTYSFRTDPRAIEGLLFAGFDAVSTANNHMLDWGNDALLDTRIHLESSNIGAMGAGKDKEEAGKPFIANIGSTTIGILAYTNLLPSGMYASSTRPGINNAAYALEQIALLRPQVDILIVSAHWGEEYKPKSNPREQKLAHEWIDAGADLIIGHHPHVIQEVEEYKGKYIAYSLGNFVFDQNFSPETMQGLMLLVKLQDGAIREVLQQKIKISKEYQPSIDAN